MTIPNALRRALHATFVLAIPALLAPACGSGDPTSAGSAERADATERTPEILPKCPLGEVPDCEPETICYPGFPPHCVIKNICQCVTGPDPFPIPFPAMPKGSGSTLPQLDLVTVTFAGVLQWDGTPMTPQAQAFGDFVVGSQWLQTVTASYRSSSPFSATHYAKKEYPSLPAGTIDIPTFLTQGLQQGTLPFPTTAAQQSGLLYAVYVPPQSCATGPYAGSSYHDSFVYNGETIAFARMCGDAPFLGNNVGPSHEIAEAITDPYSSTSGTAYTFSGSNTPITDPWFTQGEVGDACEGFVATEGGWSLATIWSNDAVATNGRSPCVPAPATYHNVSPSGPLAWQDWDTSSISLASPGSVNVSLTGWTYPSSTASWTITADVDTNTPYLSASLSSSTISNNGTVNMTLSLPAGYTSGTRAWVYVHSNASGAQTVWPFEVVVP